MEKKQDLKPSKSECKQVKAPEEQITVTTKCTESKSIFQIKKQKEQAGGGNSSERRLSGKP